MRTHEGNPRNRREAEARNRALHVLSRMRRAGVSLTAASHEEHIDPRTVRKYLGAEIRGLATGEIRATQGDRRRRSMLIPTLGGVAPVIVSGSMQASQLGRYMSAVGNYLRTGDTDALEEFEGQSIAGHRLITDPDTLSSLAQAGSLQLEDIYAVPESPS